MTKTTDIREAVQAELDFDPLVDTASITVKNIDGDVALNGTRLDEGQQCRFSVDAAGVSAWPG